MAISQGDKLPDAVLRRMGDDGPEETTIAALTAGRKIILFGLPGAFTPTCSSAHVPSFIRTKDAFLKRASKRLSACPSTTCISCANGAMPLGPRPPV